MIRGTTAQFKFKLPYTKAEIMWATIKFWQPHNPHKLLPITKTLYDCTNPSDSQELCVSLTAEETTRFVDKYKANVQLRALHTDSGTVFGCKPQLFTVYPIDDSIIDENDPIIPGGDGKPTFPGMNENGFIILDGETIAEKETE